jgi:surface protein
MNRLFEGLCHFNEDISSWDVSKVTDMGEMMDVSDVFNSAVAFNQPIDSWDVSKVTNINLCS